MTDNKTVKTVADSYRAMNSSLTETALLNSRRSVSAFTGRFETQGPVTALRNIAAHVSALANASKKDPTLHRLAHDIHSHIANTRINNGMHDGTAEKWNLAAAKLNTNNTPENHAAATAAMHEHENAIAKHANLAREHAKNFKV